MNISWCSEQLIYELTVFSRDDPTYRSAYPYTTVMNDTQGRYLRDPAACALDIVKASIMLLFQDTVVCDTKCCSNSAQIAKRQAESSRFK